MTMEQFALLGMLAKEGASFNPRDAVELDNQSFIDALKSFTWDMDNPPCSIAPKLVTRYDGMDYNFDVYKFDNYRVNIYYSINESPTMFTVCGNGGIMIFLREWVP